MSRAVPPIPQEAPLAVLPDHDPVVELRNVSKRFGGVAALSDVSLTVRRGEVHALIGENGAGKSTLLKTLFGVHRPDVGDVYHGGKPASGSAHGAVSAGLAMISQELSLVPELTVAQNVMLGAEPTRRGRILWPEVEEGARMALAELGQEAMDVGRPVRELTIAQQQLVEVARAVRRRPRLIVMDEPTSSLAGAEVGELLAVVGRLRAGGASVIYVSHRLEEVLAVADRVTVLRDGRVVVAFEAPLPEEDELIRRMVGRELAADQAARPAEKQGDPLLEIRGIEGPGIAEPASLTVRAGEVVGLAGLVGAGRTELARLIFGAQRATAGTVEVAGRRLEPGSPSASVAAGLAFLTEDRKGQGLLRHMSITSNVTLPVLRRFPRAGVLLDHASRRASALERTAEVGLARSPGTIAGELSGGNQQKVILARWLSTGARVFIFDEPTRGVDVGAKAEIHRLIDGLAAQGCAVLVVSSELPEIRRLSHRILVMRRGEIVLDAPAPGLDDDTLGAAMVGAGGETP